MKQFPSYDELKRMLFSSEGQVIPTNEENNLKEEESVDKESDINSSSNKEYIPIEELSLAKEKSPLEELSLVKELSSMEELSLVKELSSIEKLSLAKELSLTEAFSLTKESSSTEDISLAKELSSTEEIPLVKELSSTDDFSSAKIPSSAEEPHTMEEMNVASCETTNETTYTNIEETVTPTYPLAYEYDLENVPNPENSVDNTEYLSPDSRKRTSMRVNYCKVRILHAASMCEPIRVEIGGKMVTSRLLISKVSDYLRIIDGYRTVMVCNAVTGTAMARVVLPFIAGTNMTLVVINTVNGIDVIQVSDEVCQCKPMNRSCFRVANFSFDEGPFDIVQNNCTVFSDIRTKEVSAWKQAVPGEYDFFVIDSIYDAMSVNTMNCRDMSNGTKVPQFKNTKCVIDFFVKMNCNTIYTAYIIGSYYSEAPLQVVIVES